MLQYAQQPKREVAGRSVALSGRTDLVRRIRTYYPTAGGTPPGERGTWRPAVWSRPPGRHVAAGVNSDRRGPRGAAAPRGSEWGFYGSALLPSPRATEVKETCAMQSLGKSWGPFSCPSNPKKFAQYLSHRILRYMHVVLNVDERKN
jgi:hypothetical protein